MIHGLSHSEQVRSFGLAIAHENGANPEFVRLFAALHDSCRENDSADPEHGIRAAKRAREHRGEFQLADPLFEKLLFCCAYHNCGLISSDVEIGTCWDADRLDLSRVGVVPDARCLSTEAAKRMLAKRVYKVTDSERRSSYGNVTWGPGVTHRREENPTAPPDFQPNARQQREPGMLYAFKHPLIAAMFAPVYARPIDEPFIERRHGQFRLWEADGEGVRDFGVELMCSELTTLREIPLPSVTPEQRVRFGILCALECSQPPPFSAWAENWLTGLDRSYASASSMSFVMRQNVPACWIATAAELMTKPELHWRDSAGFIATSAAGLFAEAFPKIDLVRLIKQSCEWDRCGMQVVRSAGCLQTGGTQ